MCLNEPRVKKINPGCMAGNMGCLARLHGSLANRVACQVTQPGCLANNSALRPLVWPRRGARSVNNLYTWRPAACLGVLGKTPKSKDGNPFFVFHHFSMIFWSKPIPKPPGNIADHFGPVWTSPDLTRPILHRFYILNFFS